MKREEAAARQPIPARLEHTSSSTPNLLRPVVLFRNFDDDVLAGIIDDVKANGIIFVGC